METLLTNKELHGVLFLPSPPANSSAQEWYGREIAGVPYLLRNIINIQRAGINRLTIFIDKTHKDTDDFYQHIIEDARISLKLDCLSDSQQMMQQLDEAKELILLDGSSLYDKAKVAIAMTPDSDSSGSSCFLSEPLSRSLMESTTNINSSLFEQFREHSIASLPKTADCGKYFRVYFPESSAIKISKETDFQREAERIVKTAGGLKNDSFVTQILSRPISKKLTQYVLKTTLTPNQITIFSFILGIGSAWCFYQGGYQMGIYGAGLLLISIWIDGVDGEVARIKFMETNFGKELDIICDNVVHIAVFVSIGMGLFHISSEVIYIYLGLLAALGSLISFLMLRSTIIDDKSKANSISQDEQKNSDFIKKLANRDFTHFLFLLALVNQLEIFIWMTAIGVNLLSVYLIFSKLRLKLRAD